MSTPVVVNGLVYVGSGGNDMLTRTASLMERMQYHGKAVWGVPGGDEVVALSVKDGSQRWRFRTVGEDMPSPVYDRGRIVFANGDWHAYALRADNGAQLWQQDIGGVSTMASATLAGGNVLVAACTDGIRNSNMIALKPDSGQIAWQSPYGHCDASPTYADGKIFTADVEPGSLKYVGRTIVAALDPKTGKAIWTYRAPEMGMWTTLGSDEAAIAGTYDNGTYYQAAPLDDQLIAFNAANGKIRWSLRTAGPVKMSPVVKNGRVYVGDTVGLFYIIDSATGKLVKIEPFKKPFTTSPPVIVGDTLFVVNGESVRAVPLPAD
jgi:outer membrane protein assembly factor BamB